MKTVFQSVHIANSSNVPENQLSLSLSPSRANQQGSYTAAAYATQQGHPLLTRASCFDVHQEITFILYGENKIMFLLPISQKQI